MAYLALLWKARTIEKYRLKYEKEKINSILATNTELPKSTFYRKWTVYRNDSQKRFQRICKNWCPEGSNVAKTCICLGANWGFVLKIVIGFVGVTVLTYFWYKVFVFEFAVWSVISWIIAVAITLGIAFSYRVRCLVLLLVPGLFSRVGRYTLACYALVLILTGPATNTLKNLDTLSDSLACGQEQIKSSVNQINESKDSPLNLVKETMSGTVEVIQELASKIKELMVKIHRLTMSIAHLLQFSLSWLNSVEATCNKNLGTPFEHCTNILGQGIKNCEKEFPEYSRAWNWDVIVRAMCFTLKPADPICVVGDFAKGSIVATVKKKLNTFSSRIQALLFVAVHIRRSHSYCSNGSLPVSQAAAGIVTDLRNRADPLLTWLSWSCTLTGLFLLLIIFRAKYYQHMFRTRSRFDNRYVTKELRELDLKRQRQGRETVLPLNTRERAKYVSTASFRLLPSERMYLTRSIVFMVITTFKLMIHMVADYSLYWVLMNIRFHGSAPANFQPSDRTSSILVSGSGPLAAIVRMIVEALSVPLIRPAPSPTSCLPDPNPPDLQRYAQIGTLIFLLWLLALFEPYGLRLRHVITGHYQPERAKARAVWLYYHIIRTRSCFLKYARRKLHRQYKYTSEEKLTFKRWLNDCIPCRCLRCLLRVGPEDPHCLLCYTKHRQDDLDRHLKRCDTPSCPGVYCARCFTDIGQLCTICYSPEDYGDLSDVSLEKFYSDSSGNDDSDDNYKGDNKPLLGAPDYVYELEDDEHATQSKLVKKNKRHMRSRSTNKDNQEQTPLLNCDYLNKAYNQQEKPLLKYDTDNILNLQKQNQSSTQSIGTALKPNDPYINENISDEELQTNHLVSLDEITKYLAVSDTEIIVKGVTIPKEKMGAVVKPMFTTKVNDDDDDYKINHKHKPFEYVVMEMFQSLGIFKRITLARHIRCSSNRTHVRTEKNNESFKKEIPYLYSNPTFQKKISSRKALVSKGLTKDFKVSGLNPRNVQSDFQKREKYGNLLKRNRDMRPERRNVKRYLELKKIITSDVIRKLSKRNINYNKYKFIYRRRRLRNECFYSNIIPIVTNVFSDKTIGKEGLEVTLDKNVEANKLPIKINMRTERKKYLKNNKKSLAINKKCIMQETGWSIKQYMDNFSNIATAGTLTFKSVDRVNEGTPSKQTDETNGVEIEKKSDRKIMELEIKETTTKKLGFWTRLFLRNRGNDSPSPFISCVKDESLSNNACMNHKKRKKTQINDQTNVVNTPIVKPSKVNDDARNYRISLYLKDHEWFTKSAKYNSILDVKNDETLLGLNSKISKRLTKEMERLKKEEIKNMKRIEQLKRFNEAKLKKAERKAKPTKEKRKDKKKEHRDVRSGTELIYLCDEQNDINNGIELKPSRLDLGLKTILKSISQMALKLSKNKGIEFSEAGVKFSEDSNEVKNKIIQGKDECKVLSTEEVEKEQTHSHAMLCNLNSNDKIETQETPNAPQNFEYQIISHEHKPSEVTFDVEDERYENSTQTELKPRNSITNCSHIWHVEPKKQGTCQTEKLELNSYQTGQKVLHTTSRCFQVGVIPETNVQSSEKSLKNSKRTQLTTVYNKSKKGEKDKVTKTREDKEVSAYPELESRGSQYEAIWQMDKQTQVRSNGGKHVETQCFPAAVLFPLHSSAVETERTETRAFASQCHPAYREQFLKEPPESLIPPYATIEYTDEKPLKVKRTRINEIATSNQSTTTDTKTLADVSTTTSDWWSPILERKEMKRKQASQEDKCRAAATGIALNIKPQYPQYHPADTVDVLSPSRYLLQSEYYSQIYSMELGSQIGSSRLQRYDEIEPLKHHKVPRGPKTKRLEECYSPRKRILQSSTLNLVPAKWRPAVAEEQAHALKYYKRRSSKNLNQKSRKVGYNKKRSRNMQVNSGQYIANGGQNISRRK